MKSFDNEIIDTFLAEHALATHTLFTDYKEAWFIFQIYSQNIISLTVGM